MEWDFVVKLHAVQLFRSVCNRFSVPCTAQWSQAFGLPVDTKDVHIGQLSIRKSSKYFSIDWPRTDSAP